MRLHQLPLETWMVVNVSEPKRDVVSLHASRDAAETERDQRNRGLTERRFSAFIAFEPVSERMGPSVRLMPPFYRDPVLLLLVATAAATGFFAVYVLV